MQVRRFPLRALRIDLRVETGLGDVGISTGSGRSRPASGRVPFGLRAVRLGEPPRRLERITLVFVVQEDCAAIRSGGG